MSAKVSPKLVRQEEVVRHSFEGFVHQVQRSQMMANLESGLQSYRAKVAAFVGRVPCALSADIANGCMLYALYVCVFACLCRRACPELGLSTQLSVFHRCLLELVWG